MCKTLWKASAWRIEFIALFCVVFVLISNSAVAQQLAKEEAPFYNGIFGSPVEEITPALAALSAERANSKATGASITARLNAVVELLLEQDTKMAARLGRRLRIAHGFYLNPELTDYQFHSAFLEADALYRLGKIDEALQPALPFFLAGSNLPKVDDQLRMRWQSLKIDLLQGATQISADFQRKLRDAREKRQTRQTTSSIRQKRFIVPFLPTCHSWLT